MKILPWKQTNPQGFCKIPGSLRESHGCTEILSPSPRRERLLPRKPHREGEVQPLLLPAVEPEQATLGTAAVDKQALPDLGALPLQPKPKKCAFLQGQPGCSSSKAEVGAAGEGWGRAHQTVPFGCGWHKQGSEQPHHAMVYLGCTQTCPITLPEPGPLHPMEILLPFSSSPQISHSEETATKVIHMLSTRHCVATSCMWKLIKVLNLDGFNTCFSHTLFSFLVGPFLSLLDSHILRHICRRTSYGSIFILNCGIFWPLRS